MIEVVLLVILVVVVIATIFGYASYRDQRLGESAQRAIVSAKEKLKIKLRTNGNTITNDNCLLKNL